ncbi:ABC-F family ATP-binding cassette domain-containing protein [Roseospirillum parvum]|uniref:ATP-binding protein Uup n=1 Tax=Roseospirillum parvum TaxID=83401 RepID=A0A1G7UK28_9PROT|nr:ABC-F family ATP-binding cassette domain-containing protein [Roseospirillum parvum]SDG47847.1 ATP-binding cassette, subfamily F, uup [Roseospirillum parvum]
MAPPPLLTLDGIRLGFGGRPLFTDIDLAVATGQRLCLVGRNGSGKSTLLKVCAGLIEPDSGSRALSPGALARYLPQEPEMPPAETVRAWIAGGLSEVAAGDDHKADILIDQLGLPAEAALGTLSGGQKRRVALARALIGEPDLLLLDEPTNHLDLAAIGWLEARLQRHRGALLVISHDRAFLERVTNQTLWLDHGTLRRAETGFAGFEAWAEAVMEAEAQAAHKLNRKIAEETRWLREGLSARRRRNMGRVRRLQELRQQRTDAVARLGRAALAAEAGSLSGKLVIEAEQASAGYDTERPIIRDLSLRVLRGDRIGIVGANGAGKTTLVRLLIGQLAPLGGTIRHGTNLTPAVLDQDRAGLDPEATPWQVLVPKGGDQIEVNGRWRHVAGYLKDFLFEDRQFRSPVSNLSGGERNRLLLARDLARPANLMVLDEPTNDLDMDTLDLLAEVLTDYEGTLILVSHDRDFLDRLVTATLVIEADGRVSEYAGGYSDALAQRGAPLVRPLGDSPTTPGKTPKAAKAPGDKPAGNSTTKPTGGRQAKLSYKETRDLELLPARVAELEDQAAALEAALADPEAYSRDPAAFQANTEKLAALRAELEAAEHRWLELSLKQDELGGG